MTRFQFDSICNIIQSGAPCLAKELCGALHNLVASYNDVCEKFEKDNAELEQKAVNSLAMNQQINFKVFYN